MWDSYGSNTDSDSNSYNNIKKQLNYKKMGPLGTAALGIGSEIASGAGNLIFGEFQQKQALRGQQKALAQQNAAAMDIWEKTNYKPQMEQLEKAGLNPGLIYGMGGAGGTLGGASGSVNSGTNQIQGMGIQGAMQLALMKAQKENIEADTANKLAGKGKTEAETPGAAARSTMDAQEAEIRKQWHKVLSGRQTAGANVRSQEENNPDRQLRPQNYYRDWETDRKSTRLNSSHITRSRMPSSA